MASILKVGDKWRAQVRRKGHPSVARTFDKKALAEAWARKIEEDQRVGEFGDPRAAAALTIKGLIEKYEVEVARIKPLRRSKSGALEMLKRGMPNISVSTLTAQHVIDYARKRQEAGAGGVTVGMELSYLATMLKFARSLWRIHVTGSPVADARQALKHVGMVDKSKSRDRRPTKAELDAICKWFDDKPRQRIPMSRIIRFAVATAMRAGEITSIRWSDLNEEDRTVVIRDRKHPDEKIGNDQIVPLLKVGDLDAFAIAKEQEKEMVEGDDRIFPYNSGSFSSLFPRAVKALGIVDLRFHDLRHEGISRLFEAGYRIEQVALVSGHRNWQQLKRYTQIRAKDLHRN